VTSMIRNRCRPARIVGYPRHAAVFDQLLAVCPVRPGVWLDAHFEHNRVTGTARCPWPLPKGDRLAVIVLVKSGQSTRPDSVVPVVVPLSRELSRRQAVTWTRTGIVAEPWQGYASKERCSQ
jgi:hypothetical protein